MPPFRKLRWRLTLSYMAVTVAALLIAQMAVVAMLNFLALFPILFPERTVREIENLLVRPELVSLIERRDSAQLEKWIRDNIEEDTKQPEDVMLVIATVPPIIECAITDGSGNVLASYPESKFLKGNALLAQIQPDEQDLVQRSQRGERTWMRFLGGFHSQPAMTAAVPIKTGTAMVRIIRRQSWQASMVQILASAIPTAVLVTFVTAIVGSMFGHFQAGRLTRRLEALSAAAHQWSKGLFAGRVPTSDRNRDELDLLTADLNQMAEQLDRLSALRQSMAAIEERNRLARELHDTVKQHVFAATMQLGALRARANAGGPLHTDALTALEGLLREIQQEIQSIIQNLSASQQNGSDLSAICRNTVDQWQSRNSIEVGLSVQDSIAAPEHVALAFRRV